MFLRRAIVHPLRYGMERVKIKEQTSGGVWQTMPLLFPFGGLGYGESRQHAILVGDCLIFLTSILLIPAKTVAASHDSDFAGGHEQSF